MITTSFTSGSGTWPVPTGVNSVIVQLWGAGAAGSYGYGNPNANGGNGGGGGAYLTYTYATPNGSSLIYSVGVGGGGTSDGGDSTVRLSTQGSFSTLTAGGGNSGGTGMAGGTWSDPAELGAIGTNGGTGTAGILDGAYESAPGGDGGAGGAGANGGAGGAGGAGLASYTGNPQNGFDGVVPGGGGGGGGSGGVMGGTPGRGAYGMVSFSYPGIYFEVGSGGVTSGGSSNYKVTRKITASGGMLSGGSSNYKTIIGKITSSGGIKSGGVSPYGFRFTFRSSGGVIAGGVSKTRIVILARGGVVSGGVARHVSKYHNVSSGGVFVGGHSPQKRSFSAVASGGLTVSGNSSFGIKDRHYNVIGGAFIGGSANYRSSFNVDLTLLWNVRQRIFVDTTLLWNIGNNINYWYRIIASDKCSHDPCCQKYILNVHATSQSQLCQKLTQRGYNFTILSVQQFSVPADTAQAALITDQGNCNTFIPVPLCNIPLCAEFCVQYDELITAEADMSVQVNAFFRCTAVGGVFITGQSDCSFDRHLPNFPYVANGGIIMGGQADAISYGYSFVSSGNMIVMGGTAGIRASNWNFIGGEWPNTSRVRLGTSTESIADLSTDRPWSLTDYVLAEDGLFASVDISYARTSQFLVVEGFNISIPEDSNILHIYATVRRKSNQLGIRDVDAYIFNSDDEIISDNMAITTIDWPYLIESATTYDFTDQFDIDEINAGFGFALRACSTTSSSPAVAMVDVVTVEVIYEDQLGQKIRIGGNAGVISSAYSWVASGGITMGGSSRSRLGVKYISNGMSVVVGGNYQYGLKYEASGGFSIGGDSDCRPSYQRLSTNGGVSVGGTADVKPYFEYGSGGLTVGGVVAAPCNYKIKFNGGIKTGGSSVTPPEAHFYEASGGFSIGGTSYIKSNSWNFVSDGNVVFVTGEANCFCSNLPTSYQNMQFDMTVDNILVEFASYQDLQNATGLNQLLARCGCLDVPLVLNLDQSIASNNSLAQFLNRNNYTISNRLKMQYNAPNDSWQTNLYYKGYATDANSQETWNIMFDVQCTQNLGGIFIGRQVWKVSMEVVRKNQFIGTHNTRIVIGILPDELCAANELNFILSVDSQTGTTQVTPTATIYQSLVYDGIGLFKNNYWITSPDLSFTISQAGLPALQNSIDVTSQVLVS